VRCSESQSCPRKREVPFIRFYCTISHVSVCVHFPFVILSGQSQNRSLHMMSFYAQSGKSINLCVGMRPPPLKDPCLRCQSVYRDEPRLDPGSSGAAAQSLPPAKKATILFSFRSTHSPSQFAQVRDQSSTTPTDRNLSSSINAQLPSATEQPLRTGTWVLPPVSKPVAAMSPATCQLRTMG
jgi:hypothetical protein